MAKRPKRRKKAAGAKLPNPSKLPGAFWLSPEGAVIPVNVHAETLMLMPELFGLTGPPRGKEEVNAAMGDVVFRGWIRARLSDSGVLNVQIWEVRPESVAAICNVVFGHKDVIDHVVVDTVEPKGWWQFTADEYLDKAYPESWRLGDPE